MLKKMDMVRLKISFRKYIEQDLDDVDGTITEEGSEPAELKNSNIKSTQDQYLIVVL